MLLVYEVEVEDFYGISSLHDILDKVMSEYREQDVCGSRLSSDFEVSVHE